MRYTSKDLICVFFSVYLGYHSFEQVATGLAVGYIFGVIWRERFININT